jgi:tetratricopeptide (TPR) repeat protein
MLIALLAVVGSSALSGLFSGRVALSFLGQGFEIGTALNILILSMLSFLIPALFRAKEHIFWSYIAFLASFVLLSVFHILRLALGADVLSFGVFPDIISNAVGKWNDLGIFFGASALLSLITLEFLPLQRLLKIVIYVALALSLFFLAVVNFSIVWLTLGVFSLIFLVYAISFGNARAPAEGEGEAEAASLTVRPQRQIPVPSLLVLIISVIFVLAGDTMGSRIGGAFGISQLEVRPSWGATFEISRHTLAKDPLFGAGSNQFTAEWLKYKPDGVNSTAFWNVDFNYGVGLIPTFLVTTGILGLLAWVAFFLAFLYAGFRAILSDVSDRLSRYLTLSSFLVALFFWVFSIFYVPSLAIFSLTFIFTGLFIASLAISRREPLQVISFVNDPRAGFVSTLMLIFFLVGSVAIGYDLLKKYAASALFQRGVISFNTEGSAVKAEGLISRAAALSPTDLYYRFLADLSLFRMNGVLRRDPAAVSVESSRTEFQNLLSIAILNARRAVEQNPSNYENHLTLGRVYEAVVPLRIAGSYEAALAAYSEALARNPKSPAIPLSMARLEAAKGDNAKARENIALALRVKGNYTEAIFFLSQIEAVEGNIKAAILSAEAASVIAPDDPTIFFQLGILRFNDKNYRGAADALERAVALNPEYANAKYFLGLSYEKLERDADAIKQFTDLTATNPGNKEVDLILRNLKAGRDPFSDAAPPLDAAPEKRPKLPVAEKKAAALEEEE